MTVLVKREVWRRPKLLAPGRTPELTDEERENVRTALRFLRVRHGSSRKLAAALGVNFTMLKRTAGPGGRPGAALALRAARLAGISVEDVLSGAWPGDRCPHCGRV
jgi:hypothetical protein